MEKEKLEKELLLRDLYYSPKTGFRSAEHLWKLAKEENSGISKSFVKKWLLIQATYTKFKKWNNPKHYRHTFVRDFDHIQMDLIETSAKEKKENKGYNFIFVAIEILSRTAFAYPQRSKSGDDTVESLKKLIKDFEDRFHRRPKSIQSDDGLEFRNKKAKEFYTSLDIEWYK